MSQTGGNVNQSAVRQPPHVSPGIQPNSNAALRNFFDNRDGFSHNPSNPAWQEYRRLARFLQWNEETAEDRGFKNALVQTFNATYGTDENSFESWTALYRVLRITPMPEDLMACRKAVQSVFVNLVDLVDHPRTGKPVRLFSTEVELSGLLKHLLRQIQNPRRELGVRGPRRRKRRRR